MTQSDIASIFFPAVEYAEWIITVQPHLDTWEKSFHYITKLSNTDSSVAKLLAMLSLELGRHGGPREKVLSRLHGRLTRLRSHVEADKMQVYAKRR